MNILRMLFGFEGRINRAKYWLALLIYLVIVLLVIVAAMAVTPSPVMYAVGVAIYIAIAASGIAVGIKRLHDRNKSGWWLLAFYGVPIALNAAGYYALDDDAGMLGQMLLYVSFAINIWAVVELGCLRGTIGANPYGADPLAPQPAPPRTLR